MRRADYLKTSKVRHKEAEEASLVVGLGASGGLCTIVTNLSPPVNICKAKIVKIAKMVKLFGSARRLRYFCKP